MARRWKVEAMSIGGRMIEVYVSQKQWSGDVVLVEAAANAIEWADDDDRDILLPVRGQSGYLRVIDDGSGEVDDMMPRNNMENYVEVWCENSMVWQGYMQAATYTASWDIAPKVVEFPLIDGLTALESVYMDSTKEMSMVTLAELTYEAIMATGLDIKKVVYPKEVMEKVVFGEDGKGYATPWMLEVSRFNFFEKSDAVNYDDPEYQRYDGITYRELLEEIAKLWGWRVVIRGWKMLFISTEATNYYEIDTLRMLAYASGIEGTEENVNIRYWLLEGLDWMSTDHTIERLQGCNKMEVTVTTKEVPQEIKPKIDELETYKDCGTLGDRNQGLVENLIVREAGDGLTVEAMLYSEWGTKIEDWDNAEVIETTKGAVFANDHVGERAGRDDEAVGWSFAEAIRIYLRRTNAEALPTEEQSSASPVIRLTVPEGVVFGNGGALVISGKVRGIKYQESGGSYIISETNGRCYLPIEVQIGDKWYVREREEQWQEEKNILRVRCGDQDDETKEDGDGKIVNTAVRSNMFENADGYVMPLAGSVRGKMTVTIYAPWEVGQSDVIIIEEFKITYTPRVSATKEKSGDNHFRAILKNGFKQEKEVELMMGTRGNGAPSYSYMTLNGLDVGVLLCGGEEMRPEEALLGKLKRHYNRIIEVLTVDVADDQTTDVMTHLAHGWNEYMLLAEAVEPLEDKKRIVLVNKY